MGALFFFEGKQKVVTSSNLGCPPADGGVLPGRWSRRGSFRLYSLLRKVRGWLYRRLPVRTRACFVKKLAGFERRWNLEGVGFTKEGFLRIFFERMPAVGGPGILVELGAGDGLVGSLGVWLESEAPGWRVICWEHRPTVLAQLRQNRPSAEIRSGRLTRWSASDPGVNPKGVTTRGVREASGICRAIRNKRTRPFFVGIWNPTRRPVWMHRLGRVGYRLEMVYERMEFYRDRR